MARVAFAWELGGGLGHIVPLWDLGLTLAERGHEIAFILREPSLLARMPGGDALTTFAAPRDPDEGRVAQVPATYPEILLSCGYATAASLRPLVRGWLEALDAFQPDFIVEDYAPTSLLAGLVRGIPRARCANGFSIPPRTTPMPVFRTDLDVPASRILDSERRALESVNTVLAELGRPPLERLADMLATDEEFLCTLPELDHYGGRPPSGYWGPRVRFHVGREVAWPKGQGPRVLAYLHESTLIGPTLQALGRRNCRIVAYVVGLTPEHRALLEGPGRLVSDELLRIDTLLPGCDLVMSHGGGISPGTMLAGVPQYVLPQHYEQLITARRIEQMGTGGWAGTAAPAELAGQLIDMLLSQPRFRTAAQAFAARYRAFSAAEQKRRIVHRLEELFASTKAPAYTPRTHPPRESE